MSFNFFFFSEKTGFLFTKQKSVLLCWVPSAKHSFFFFIKIRDCHRTMVDHRTTSIKLVDVEIKNGGKLLCQCKNLAHSESGLCKMPGSSGAGLHSQCVGRCFSLTEFPRGRSRKRGEHLCRLAVLSSGKKGGQRAIILAACTKTRGVKMGADRKRTIGWTCSFCPDSLKLSERLSTLFLFIQCV